MEQALHFSCALLLLPALAGYAGAPWRPEAARLGRWSLLLAWAAAGGSLATRWVAAGWGHPPVASWSESLLFSAWALMGLFLALERRLALASSAPVAIITMTAAVVAALLASGGIVPLAPALRSRWLAFHAVTLAAAYAAFALAFALAAAALTAASRSGGERRRWGAAATLALLVLGSGGAHSIPSAVVLLPLAWIVLRSEEQGAPGSATTAFHLASWWALLLGLALAGDRQGFAAAGPLVAGSLLSLLSIAASPPVAFRAAARFGPLIALPAASMSALWAIGAADPFPWGAIPLAILPAIALLPATRRAPRILAVILPLLTLASAILALGEGRGSLLIAGFLGAVLLVLPERGRRAAGPDRAGAVAAEGAAFQTVLLGFPLLTAGIVSGAAWARQAWGTYWGWDPKETWSLILWLLYAAYLHARFHQRWAGPKAALFLVLGFVVLLFTYIGVSTLLPGLHSFL
jgi:ABC-type transport system involved in cytochrome c biogenesis permease subunit